MYKREALVAASKGSFRSGSLKATQSKEDWVLWASKALGTTRSLKQLADSIIVSFRLSAYGVVPLGLACLSSREALLGPAGWRQTAPSGGTGVWERRWWPKTAVCLDAVWLSLANHRRSGRNWPG